MEQETSSVVAESEIQEAPKKENKLDPWVLRRFIKHLILVTKKHQLKDQAHEELTRHIQKLKSSPPKGEKSFNNNIETLSAKISKVLEAEKRLINIEKEDIELVKTLKDEIRSLKSELTKTKEEKTQHTEDNKKIICALDDQLKQVKTKIKRHIDDKDDRKEKINQLIDKIKSAPRNKEVTKARKVIGELEDKYYLLASKGYHGDRLSDLKDRIDLLKQKYF